MSDLSHLSDERKKEYQEELDDVKVSYRLDIGDRIVSKIFNFYESDIVRVHISTRNNDYGIDWTEHTVSREEAIKEIEEHNIQKAECLLDECFEQINNIHMQNLDHSLGKYADMIIDEYKNSDDRFGVAVDNKLRATHDITNYRYHVHG